MGNKVKFGLSNVHVAPIQSISGDSITYGDTFAIKGAVNLTLDPEGESADFHGDNTKYFTAYANQGYSGSLEIAMITDEFRKKILGEQQDTNGALTESSDDTIKDFALGFQIDGDASNRRFWYYNVSVQRPSNSAKTIESQKEPNTDTLNITATPRITDNMVRTFLEKTNDNETEYNNFFDSVYEPQNVISG